MSTPGVLCNKETQPRGIVVYFGFGENNEFLLSQKLLFSRPHQTTFLMYLLWSFAVGCTHVKTDVNSVKLI